MLRVAEAFTRWTWQGWMALHEGLLQEQARFFEHIHHSSSSDEITSPAASEHDMLRAMEHGELCLVLSSINFGRGCEVCLAYQLRVWAPRRLSYPSLPSEHAGTDVSQAFLAS